MPVTDRTRILEDRARPRIMELWRALRPLTSVIRFMQSGAHPDDETSGLLAALAFRDGFNLSYACSTRGEGGQNVIGTEGSADLGALRTREMERACDALGMRLYWLSEDPGDPITDFGFSRSGTETMKRWGHDRTLARLVEIVRTDRPDILCPTFLDVPGQHGHHRAMTRVAHEVMRAAADPDFPSNLRVWRIAKLYLPAWSGAGRSYDDDEPPPPATLTVDGSGSDPVSGWTWDRIGEQSRVFHRTQGMGCWTPPGTGRDWPLHLAETHVPDSDQTLASGLSVTLADVARLPGAVSAAADLAVAADAVARAVAAFPDGRKVAAHALEALEALGRARDACSNEALAEFEHRIDAKEVQLGHAIRLGLGIEARCRVADTFLSPGQRTGLDIEIGQGMANSVRARPDLPCGLKDENGELLAARDALPTNPYRMAYDPAAPPAPALEVSIESDGGTTTVRLPFEREPIMLPACRVSAAPDAVLLNLARSDRRFGVRLARVRPEGSRATLTVPDGWRATAAGRSVTVVAPESVGEGLYSLPVMVGETPAHTVHRIDHSHAEPTARVRPAKIRVRALHVAVPEVRIGYAGGGSDRTGHWLAAMGLNVTDLSDAMIGDDDALAACDTIVVGVFAMRSRPALTKAAPRLRRWCEAGGTLVTLYHRPWDNWDPDHIPPRRLEIGQPSLRWRVTDETAEVRHLADHPVLFVPNRIGPDDWAGWVKERGLYFARSWDPAYTPLLEMADPGEAPHKGALLVADIGTGRHVHTSLVLHHQMEHLVSGAFRIMANLVACRQ